MAARKTTSKGGGIDAVAIAAVLKHPSRPDAVPMCVPSRRAPPCLLQS